MNLPYKYRGLLLLALLAVVLPGAAWHFALRDTLGMWCDCRKLTARLEALAPDTARAAVPRPSDRELILSGGLLDTVRRAATELSVLVTGYEPLVTQEQTGAAMHTARLTLSGGYTSLVRVVDTLERKLPSCRLRTLEWQVHTDRRQRRSELTLTVYVEQIVLKE